MLTRYVFLVDSGVRLEIYLEMDFNSVIASIKQLDHFCMKLNNGHSVYVPRERIVSILHDPKPFDPAGIGAAPEPNVRMN